MLTLILQSAPNPDHDEVIAPAPTYKLTIADFKQASQKCREYIEEFNLGAGNWTGGDVIENGNKVANISYNGRIWMS